MRHFFSAFILLLLALLPTAAGAHTTVLVPCQKQDGQQTVKVLHFHPASGSDLMGIRLGARDTANLKGLDSIFVIHQRQEKNLAGVVIPEEYTVRGRKSAIYTIPLDRKNGFSTPGDYIIVVKHQPHWKKHEGIFRQKVAKLYLNYWGLTTDWPRRALKNMPEIIPLVPPDKVYAGTLFRAEAVNDAGKLLPHAKIQVEYLNYELGETELDTATGGFLPENLASGVIYTDGSGSFSFIPTRQGLWTFTLLDGDDNRFIRGKALEYDSSLSILVRGK